MRALHTQYSSVPAGWCKCSRGDFFEPVRTMFGRYGQELVEIVCSECNSVASSFYREPELESESTKADKLLVGQAVQVKRFVAWVGYAKSTHTVFWSENDERTKKAQILADATGISLERADEVVNGYSSVYWLDRAANRHARYLLFREAFKSSPFPRRGLWFMDAERIVTISGILRCITGERDPGYALSSSWHNDDYEPPALVSQVHHQLYYGYSDGGQRALVYPGDILNR